MKPLASPRGVAAVCLAIGALLAIRLLAANEWDPSALAAFGETSTEITDYAEEQLDREVVTRDGLGHDGRFFFVQANDPLLREPGDHAAILDRPQYRSQRMLYPLVAGGVGTLPPEAILWGLITLNVLMIGFGSWAVAAIAVKFGAPAYAGFAFALNPGVFNELFIDGGGILAFGLAAFGAWALQDERRAWAVAAFIGAVLAREAMLIFVGLIALFWWLKKKTVPWWLVAPPVAAVAAWALYVRAVVDAGSTTVEVIELTPIPFSGLVEAVDLGLFRPAEVIMAVVILIMCVMVPIRAWRSEVYLSWGAVGFALLAPFLTAFVWSRVWDISRAVVPLITVYILQAVITLRTGSPEAKVKIDPAPAD